MQYKVVIKFFSFLLVVLFSKNIIGQDKHTSHHHVYISQSYFRSNYVKTDSIGFTVKNGDTLVAVAKYIKPNGVGVAYEKKDSTFLETYKSLAFRPDISGKASSLPMKYWKEPLKIYLTPNFSKKVKRVFSRFLKTIDKEVDSLKIVSVKSLEDANYVIYTQNDIEYETNLKTINNSGYYIYWNHRNQINKGFIKINSKTLFSDMLQIQKMKIEFILSLGWFRPSKKLDCTSYFSNCFSDQKNLKRLDLEILKYHYSYGICKGTRLKEFEEQHARAKEVLKNPRNKFVIYHNDD